ncbi:Translation factor GUF1 homolog, mitochondrial [Gryllus bimaculatus]|nr:Translation factor GUF1 homolog, mitochondrial [Gryllus bimaculatus]
MGTFTYMYRLSTRCGNSLLNSSILSRASLQTYARQQLMKRNEFAYLGCVFINTTCASQKKRKTSEEKKAPRIIQFTPKAKLAPTIEIWKNMSVADLAEALGKDTDHVFEVMRYVDNSIDYTRPSSIIDNWQVMKDVVTKSGFRYNIIAPPGKKEESVKDKDVKKRPPPDPSVLKPRPPVVTIMGHVDHGKTTLLDALRHTAVVASEFGGITQHIGAFSVKLNSGKRNETITFLDTPGHAAFKAMRARGAEATDIVVLVVAADDGVMEQTVESIRMAKEANVPIVVAINKIDKSDADVERTKKALLSAGIQVEDFGGDVQVVEVSALKGTNLDLLVEVISLQAQLLELKADPTGLVEGVVIESSTNVHRGKLATIIVQRGTLKKGAVLVAGTAWAKVRGMFDDKGQPLLSGSPSTPVEIIGWRDLPSAGDEVLEVDNEEYKAQLEKKWLMGRRKVRREGPRPKEIEEDNSPHVSIILKGDVDGSVEAILDVLETYNSNDDCQLSVIHYGVGQVTENDIELAETFGGEANVLQQFEVNEGRHKVPVAGCRCTKGVLKKSAFFRLVRGEETLFEDFVD